MNEHRNPILKSVWTYFLMTFIWTWSLCGILIFKDMSGVPSLSFIILLLAMVGPGVTGILFTFLTKSREEIGDYFKRIIDMRRITLPWFGMVVGLPFALQILSGAIDGVTGGDGLQWGASAFAFLTDPVKQLLTLCIISLVPFFEELGWRGYAQDLLQEKRSAFRASLILGCIWSLWHLPASFIPGTYQAGLGIGTIEFWLHFGGIVLLSVVVSWIYVNTNRSILIMVLFHAMVNLAGELITLSERGETLYTVGWLSAVIAIFFGFGRNMRVNQGHPFRIDYSTISFILLVVLFLQSAMVPASVIAGPDPSLKESFRKELENLQRHYNFPGITAAYSLGDGIEEVMATGMADKTKKIPMTAESRMLAASIGKTFVGATVVQLVQEGKVNLDTPIATWFHDRPWFEGIPNHTTITLRQLLNHTSGLPNHVESEEFARTIAERIDKANLRFSPEELIAFVFDKPALFPAGQGWAYSDTGYILVGLIIEAVAGQTYYDRVTASFIKPLQLDWTSPSNCRYLPKLATGYLESDNRFGLPPETTNELYRMAWDPGLEWTGGGLVSNPRDLVRWAHHLFNGQAMKGEYLQFLLEAVPIRKGSQDVYYGLGVAIHHNGPFGTTYGHGGWFPGYCSSIRYYRDYNVAIAFQINTDITIMDGTPSVVDEIERRLAEVVIRTK